MWAGRLREIEQFLILNVLNAKTSKNMEQQYSFYWYLKLKISVLFRLNTLKFMTFGCDKLHNGIFGKLTIISLEYRLAERHVKGPIPDAYRIKISFLHLCIQLRLI